MKLSCLTKSNSASVLYNCRLSSFERQVTTLKTEREKLIQISGDLKAQLLSHEKQLEMGKHQQKLKDFKLAQAKELLQVQSKETVKDSKLDQLRLEVEQMREMVNKFKVDETPELNKENISETNKTVPTSQKEFVKQQRIPSVPRYQEY